MKYAAILGVIIFLMSPVLIAQELEPVAEEPDTGVTIGGEVWGRYLHLNLQSWRDAAGKRLPKQDLFYYGGKVCSLRSDRRGGDALATGRQSGSGR